MFGAFKTVRRVERRETWIAFLVLFLVLASHALLETARDALFLEKVPAGRLPLVYLGLALTSFLVVELYERMTGAGGRIALAATLVAAGVVTFGFWIASSSRAVGFLYFLYLWPGLVTTLVTLQFWTL